MEQPYFWDDVKNSLIIVLVTVAIAMVLAFLAAIALAKYRFTGLKVFIVLMIGIQMLPQAGLIIPLYVVLAKYHQVNALSGVIITYLTFVLPFAVWTLRGFILSIPKELEEAALVDGNSRVGAFTRILLPLIAPGLVATSVFAFISCWNEYIFARVLLNDQSKQTVTVWLSYFLGSSKHTDWGALMAGVDADRDPGRRLLPPRAAQDLVRPDRGRSQGVTPAAALEWRGVMLDVARHFFGVEDVKRFVDVIARFGFNRLHLHLTDDQGWRIEIESWPRLAEVGGASAVGGGPGGFYTQRDYVEIVEHAASRGVVVVPEIDMPGHVNAARRRVSGAVAAGARRCSVHRHRRRLQLSRRHERARARVRRRRPARARRADARRRICTSAATRSSRSRTSTTCPSSSTRARGRAHTGRCRWAGRRSRRRGSSRERSSSTGRIRSTRARPCGKARA